MTFAPRHILVPVAIDPNEDFKLAQHALFAACDIAEKFSSKITLLHLAPVITPAGTVDVSGKIFESLVTIVKERHDRSKAKLQELQAYAQQRGITVEGRVIDTVESTVSVILATSHELNADLLVLGSHGRRGLSRMLFGSVAERVTEKSPIPVLLLHPDLSKDPA